MIMIPLKVIMLRTMTVILWLILFAAIKNSNNKESNNDNGIPQWNKKNNGSATGNKTSW